MAMVIGLVLLSVLTLPLAGMAAVVIATRPPDVLLESLARNIVAIGLAGLLVAGATILLGFLLWRLVSRPVRDLAAWSEQVARSDAARPARTRYGTRELARLGASFDAMVRRLKERSAYIATYTAHVSHELKSPLTAIAGAAEIIRDSGDDMSLSERARFLSHIERDALRLSALVARMRELARVETARSSGTSNLASLLAKLRERYPSVEIAGAGEATHLPLPFDDAFLVLSHLADNAAAHGARRVRVAAGPTADGMVAIVENDGAPISASNDDRIFQPFFTTRREAGGTGMGLAIVRALLETHGGDIGLERPVSGDFQVGFRIFLPHSA
ncbi:ATP-binding protein [Aquibium sp. ELW1220]|uniref:ATP-binding protein n=1 Tax=Aquibium sp. ELW1220 TaxID=2976766 RepID=UPI0025B1F220|nr:ATP-binding protein [Aquibium sp. ELW1220]MDN2583830.1 ATP-binding protein [Aquibium sp. ELW1220]